MVRLGPKTPQHRKGTMAGVSPELSERLAHYQGLFDVSATKLQEISDHFAQELTKGLSKAGGNVPMNPGWVLDLPTGKEKGDYLALDLGGTNLRVVLIKLKGDRTFESTQSKYLLPDQIRTDLAEALWDFIAECLKKFVEEEFPEGTGGKLLPLGFTFSYPATQHAINMGILQRWTKGFDIDNVEGHDVVPMLQAAIEKRSIPVRIVALINDTTGTLVASAYTDPDARMGLIFGTGCNGAYYEVVKDIPKLEGRLPADVGPETPMAINCEYGSFDNEHLVLPRTHIDAQIDAESPRPGQQAFEKMISGYYLGEVLRLVLMELVGEGLMFAAQDMTKLEQPFFLDASYPSLVELDPFENLSNTAELFKTRLGLNTTEPERKVIRALSEAIGTRAARLAACGIAGICKKRGYVTAHCAADGSVYEKYPGFKERAATALRDIFQWTTADDPIVIVAAEDGSGAGAAIIAALTEQRLEKGQSVGANDAGAA